jgi:CRP-like cAMP-binding protein
MSQFRLSQYALGDTIFQEGAIGTEAFLIRSGLVVIHRRAGDEELLLAVLRAGEVFGEMALVTEGRRTATAPAAEDTKLVTLPTEAFADHLTRGTPLLREVFESMARRLAFTSRQLRKPRTRYPSLSVAMIIGGLRQRAQAQAQGRSAVTVAEAFQTVYDNLDLTEDEICQVLDQMAAARLIEWRNANDDPMLTLQFNDPDTFDGRLAKWVDTLPEKAASTLPLTGAPAPAPIDEDTDEVPVRSTGADTFVDLPTVEAKHGMSFREIRRFIASGELPPDMIHFPAKEMVSWINQMRVAYGEFRETAYPTGDDIDE